MKKFFGIFFASLILVISLVGTLQVKDNNVQKSSLLEYVRIDDYSSPIIHVNFPNNKEVLSKVILSKINNNVLNLNGYSFNLIGLSIHASFISLKLVSLDDRSIQELTKDISSKNMNKRISLQTMNWIFTEKSETNSLSFFKSERSKIIFDKQSRIQKGFAGLNLQPPRV